jgi:DNA-binding NtrC family response regulator
MVTIDLALVICQQGEDREKAVAALLRCGLNPICCSDLREARALLGQEPFRVVLCTDFLSDGDYRAVLREVRKADKDAPVIVLSHSAEWESYLIALGDGAFDYISCPPDPAEANRIILSALENTALPGNTAYLSA